MQLLYGLNALVYKEPLFKNVIIYPYHTLENKHFNSKNFLSMTNQLRSNECYSTSGGPLSPLQMLCLTFYPKDGGTCSPKHQ
jgi:hypothetical protein